MRNKQKFTIGVLSFIACALAVVNLYYLLQVWSQKPLGPVLEYPTPLKLPVTWTAPPVTPSMTGTLAPTLVIPTVTPSLLPPCNILPTMTILAIGADAHSDEYKYGRADVIRVVRVNFMAQRVAMLEFPRDLWVKIPEISDNIGQDHDKLNTAYFYGNPGLKFWDNPSQGPGLLARTLDLNFGMRVDHYIAASMDIFIEIVDVMGGLDITLPEVVDGRTAYDKSSRLFFPAGAQHLSGEQALTLARIRNISVFERADHQNLVMCALRKKMENPETIMQIPAFISSFKDHIQTDLTPGQIGQLACLGTHIPPGNILFASFPRELFKSDKIFDPALKQDVFIWETDFNELRKYVEQFNMGVWPAQSIFATPEPGTESCQ
jgi:LCP family protein required for cell wall assembly